MTAVGLPLTRVPGAAASTPPLSADASANVGQRPARQVRWALTGLAVAVLLTSHIGVPVGAGFSLGLSLPMAYVLLLVLALNRQMVVVPGALLLYAGLVLVAAVSFLLNAYSMPSGAPSHLSLLLLLAIYLPLVFGKPASGQADADWRWTMGMVSNLLLFMAVVGTAQFALQLVFRAPWLFDASLLLPEPIRALGVYHTAIPVGTNFKANGFFQREPSGFSYTMALGLLLELALFRRLPRTLVFTLALMLSYSGTGLLALAIGLLLPLRAGTLVRLALGLGLVVSGNWLAGDPLNLAFTLGRVSEFNSPGSSAYERYLAPGLLVDANLPATPWSFWVGHGPGLVLDMARRFGSHDPTWAKLLFEYGVLGFVMGLGLVIYRLARFDAPVQLRVVVFANWLVMGGHLLTPSNVYLGFLAMALWVSSSCTTAQRRTHTP